MRRRVVIHGRVQGVFFRHSLQRVAREHGVAGWARNTPEGTVEAVFEGDPDAVERLLGFARAGPPDARVDRIEQSDEEPEDLSGFEIR